MDSLCELFVKLQPYPNLRAQLSLSQIWRFITHAALLKKDIILTQSARHDPMQPPQFLPPAIEEYLSKLLNLDSRLVEDCWTVLRDLVWNDDYIQDLN